MKTFKFYSLVKFQLCNTMLSIPVTVLCIRFSDLTHFINSKFMLFCKPFPLSPILQPLATSILFSVDMQIYYCVVLSFSIWLISLKGNEPKFSYNSRNRSRQKYWSFKNISLFLIYLEN